MDLRQRLKVLLLEEGPKKKVLGIVKEADRSPKLETSLISIARNRGTLLMVVISYEIRIRQLQIRKERN